MQKDDADAVLTLTVLGTKYASSPMSLLEAVWLMDISSSNSVTQDDDKGEERRKLMLTVC